jgi:hypothetical protein
MLSFIENNRVKVLAAVQVAMASTPFASKWLCQLGDNRVLIRLLNNGIIL